MVLFISGITFALGTFIAVFPVPAARIWGWKNFESLGPRPKASYLRSFRVMGITLGIAGFLLGVDCIWSH
jgi:hypothetical protein